MMKRILSLLLALSLLIPFLSSCSVAGGRITLLDQNGQVFAEISSFSYQASDLADPSVCSFLELALEEAVKAFAEKEDISTEKAEKRLLSQRAVLVTHFDPEVQRAICDAYESYGETELSFGSAATDLYGNVIAAFSDSNSSENRATLKTPPYSAFKPLSVYMQALEKNAVNWSYQYEDSPLKKVTGSGGAQSDWPPNATGTYSYRKVTVCEALRQSLNTVAAKCLLDVGVRNSVNFLKENFAIDLTSEETRMNLSGEEEIIGNISMGHLYGGVSPVQMAGFYQIFARGGIYTQPKAVEQICTEEGEILWQRKTEEKRVISSATATVMNKLLQKVVSTGGTGEKAAVSGIPVGGKTGTGDYGNWFVGFTPTVTLSVWHGPRAGENVAAQTFSRILSALSLPEDATYPDDPSVKEAIYCTRSGLLLSSDCKGGDLGYYQSGRMPLYCEE